VVVARVRERPLRVVADAYLSQAAFLNPVDVAGITGLSRRRQDAVGWDDPPPIVGKRSRGRPRKQGRGGKLAHLRGAEPVTARPVAIDGQEERVRVGWREGWLRDVTPKVRGVAIATPGAPLLGVSTDRSLAPAVMIQRYAARVPLELTLRALTPSRGLGDYHCQRLLAIHRCGHLALTACCLWRLTRLQEPTAPWLTTTHSTSAGKLTPRSSPRRHHALRRRVLPRRFAASAAGADCQKTAVAAEQLFRIAA
jgi:hypothetical protein